MNWKKLGLIVKPGLLTWMVTHAQNPFIEDDSSGRLKIHFAGRDKMNRARGGVAEIDMDNPLSSTVINPVPTIDLGNIGCFDDCGTMPSTIVNNQNKKYMYYTGWSQAVTTPFTFFIGLAISNDGGATYKRFSKAPVLGRTHNDPFLTCSPWVLIENNIWKMWYVSGTEWEISGQNDIAPKHYYHIKYAESTNGIDWITNDEACIDFNDDEYAIARPVVSHENGIYKMWYCYRGGYNTYRAGYAESNDGKAWTRKDDQVGINVSNDGWDSQMICYPSVFNYNGQRFLLYNGNGFGQAGCGLAVLESD
jgi:hypothetical protein